MKAYRIAHITDLLKVPQEHWDECLRDLRGVLISLQIVEAAAACIPGAVFDPAKHCPYVEFTPDGLGNITPTTDGEPLFNLRVTKDEVNLRVTKEEAPQLLPASRGTTSGELLQLHDRAERPDAYTDAYTVADSEGGEL